MAEAPTLKIGGYTVTPDWQRQVSLNPDTKNYDYIYFNPNDQSQYLYYQIGNGQHSPPSALEEITTLDGKKQTVSFTGNLNPTNTVNNYNEAENRANLNAVTSTQPQVDDNRPQGSSPSGLVPKTKLVNGQRIDIATGLPYVDGAQTQSTTDQQQPIDYTLHPGESTQQYNQRIAQARGEQPIPGVQDGTQQTGAQSQANIDYTLHPGETIPQYNARIATSRGDIPGSTGTGGTNTYTDSGFADSQSGKGLSAGGQGQSPSTFIGIYKDIIKTLGLTDIKAEFKKTVEEQAKLQNELNDKISEINDDPWLSEGIRVKQIEKMKEKYDTKLQILTNKQQIYDSLYKEGVQQAQYLATGEYNAQADAAALAEKRYEAQLKLQEIDPSNFKEVRGGLYDIKEQKWIVQPKPTGDGGLSTAQMNTTINSIAGSFDNEPIVKNYNTATEGYQTIKSLGVDSNSPADDIAFIYAFAKIMDPNSVVREGEYNTIQKYAQSWADTFGFKAQRIYSNTNFLSPDAKQKMLNTLDSKIGSITSQYNNLYSQYQQRISNVQSGGFNSLTDYSQAFPNSGTQSANETSQPVYNGGTGKTSRGVTYTVVTPDQNTAITPTPIQQTNPYSWSKLSTSQIKI